MTIFILFLLIIFGMGWTSILFPKNSLGLQFAISALLLFLWICVGGVVLGFLQMLTPIYVILWIAVFLGCSLFSINKHPLKTRNISDFYTLDTAILSIATILYLILASPPIWYRDSLTYHATLPKLWAQNGGYQATDQILFEFFPSLWQWGLSFLYVFGEAPLFHPRYLGVFLTMMTVLILREIISFQSHSKIHQSIGILCYVLIPTVLEFGTSIYVMPWLSFLCISSVFFHLHTSQQENESLISKRANFILEIVTGAAIISSKYSGLIWIFCLVLLKKKQHIRYLFGVGILGSFFYIRNFILHKNPFFPKFSDLFGYGFWGEWRSDAYEYTLQDYGYGRDLLNFLALPFRMFTTIDMQYGFQGSLGPTIGILFVVSLYYYRDIRIFVICWFVIWALQVQQIRFLIPMISIVIAYGITKIPPKYVWIPALLSLSWSVIPIQKLWERQQGLQYWTMHKTDSDFLERQIPQNYPIDRFLNNQGTVKKVWYVWMRGYVYYLDKDVRLDSVFGAWRFEELLDISETSEDIQQYFYQQNISHIAINHSFFLVDNNADLYDGRTQKLQQKFHEILEKKIFVPIFDQNHVVVYEIQ